MNALHGGPLKCWVLEGNVAVWDKLEALKIIVVLLNQHFSEQGSPLKGTICVVIKKRKHAYSENSPSSVFVKCTLRSVGHEEQTSWDWFVHLLKIKLCHTFLHYVLTPCVVWAERPPAAFCVMPALQFAVALIWISAGHEKPHKFQFMFLHIRFPFELNDIGSEIVVGSNKDWKHPAEISYSTCSILQKYVYRLNFWAFVALQLQKLVDFIGIFFQTQSGTWRGRQKDSCFSNFSTNENL